MKNGRKVPLLIWLVSFLVIGVSLAKLLFLYANAKSGSIIQPGVSVVYSVVSIACAVGLLKLRAWPLVAFLFLTLIQLSLMAFASQWLLGVPSVPLSKFLFVSIIPLLFIGAGIFYSECLSGWPLMRRVQSS